MGISLVQSKSSFDRAEREDRQVCCIVAVELPSLYEARRFRKIQMWRIGDKIVATTFVAAHSQLPGDTQFKSAFEMFRKAFG
jgi:hypothetical protein